MLRRSDLAYLMEIMLLPCEHPELEPCSSAQLICGLEAATRMHNAHDEIKQNSSSLC